jgi:GNAT superfamily N-acetyltransferase
MIDPTVRDGAVEDRDELERLEQEARGALVDARGGARWLDTHPAHGPTWSPLHEGRVIVADLDGVVVGALIWSVDPTPSPSGERVARVESVYVTPGAREVGFGDELLAAALTRAGAAGATLFEAEALPGDRDTKNLYERAGITARSITVSTRLADPT